MAEIRTYKGSCHCGAVTFEADISLDGLIECNCSPCYRKGLVLAFAPRPALRLAKGEGATTSYFFNRHNIEHSFCKTCGVQPYGYGKGPDGAEMAAINVRTLEDVEPWAWSAERVDGRSF